MPPVANIHNAAHKYSNTTPQTGNNTTFTYTTTSLDSNLSELVKKLDGEIDSTIEKYKINQLKGLGEDENITLHQNEVRFLHFFLSFI